MPQQLHEDPVLEATLDQYDVWLEGYVRAGRDPGLFVSADKYDILLGKLLFAVSPADLDSIDDLPSYSKALIADHLPKPDWKSGQRFYHLRDFTTNVRAPYVFVRPEIAHMGALLTGAFKRSVEEWMIADVRPDTFNSSTKVQEQHQITLGEQYRLANILGITISQTEIDSYISAARTARENLLARDTEATIAKNAK